MAFAMAAVALGVPGARAAAQDAAADSGRSTLAGAYTEAQARRGRDTYQRHCTECHVSAAITGVVFQRAWSGRTLFDYYELIRTTMPNDNPGKLSRGQYADVVAYLLKLSGMPPGNDPVPSDAAALRTIRIESPPAR
jgi:mono/diheme cytochrome c family protein